MFLGFTIYTIYTRLIFIYIAKKSLYINELGANIPSPCKTDSSTGSLAPPKFKESIIIDSLENLF
jgi:hypothetical protein